MTDINEPADGGYVAVHHHRRARRHHRGEPMTTIALTPARGELLRAVAAGEVKHHTRQVPSENFDEWRPGGYGGKRVTAGIRWLREAGLIRQGPKEHASFFAPAPWRLTEAGEKWLAEHEEDN